MIRPKSPTLRLLTGCCLVLQGADLAAQDPELIVQIEKQQIYEGESVVYRVTLNHVENPSAPALAGFDDFQVEPLGEQSLDSRQITIINGRRSEVVRRGRQYNYRLTPRTSGSLTIPAPTAQVGSDVLVGREIALQVTPPDEQDSVILTFTSDRSAIYPMQPFRLTLSIAVKELPGEYKDRDPLGIQQTPPALDAAWLSDDRVAEGVKPEQSWRELLKPIISRQGEGFQINNIGTSSVFSLFEDQATRFHPQPRRTVRTDDDGNEVGYWEYDFQRTFVAEKLGSLQFGPVTLKGTIADGLQNGKLVGRRLYAFAPALTVTVKDVPREGRPDAYIGAVGEFDVRADLAPTSARVGDPLTLTVTLSGQGTLADARPPSIAALPGIDGAFRTYDATEEAQPGVRRFTYSLRPLNTDVLEFPKIPISYFDVGKEEFVTIETDPIPISIRAAEVLADSEIVSTPANPELSTENLEVSAGGVFANDSALNALRNETVRVESWLLSWGLMIVGWAAALLSIRTIQRIREDPALLRRRSAASRAQAAVQDATSQLASGHVPEACESLRRALTGLVADYANVSAAGVTPRDAAQRLSTLGVEPALQNATLELLNQCDAARYGAASEGVARLVTDATELVNQLVAELKKSTRRSPSAQQTSLAMLLLLGLFSSGCSSTPDLQTVQAFQAAEQAFARATSPAEFVHVARQYQQAGGAAFTSGAMLYNQGNAWMRAAETGRAIAAYRQAHRYRPRDPYLAANLRNAIAASGRSAEPPAASKVVAALFFWQNWLSYPEKWLLSTLLLAAALVASLLGRLSTHRLAWHRFSLAFGFLWLLAATSTGWDWYRFDYLTHGVVISDEAVARKGNSDTYAAAFTNPLTEGTEFVVVEKRGDWLHVEVGSAATGWLRERAVTTY